MVQPPEGVDKATWGKAMKSVGHKALTGLMYFGDILGRPSFALGNLWDATINGDADQLWDIARQFVPFGEKLEEWTGLNVAPDKKEFLGTKVSDYLQEEMGWNPWLAGAIGFATDWYTDPLRIKQIAALYRPWKWQVARNGGRRIKQVYSYLKKNPSFAAVVKPGETMAASMHNFLKTKFARNSTLDAIKRAMELEARGIESDYAEGLGMLNVVLKGDDIGYPWLLENGGVTVPITNVVRSADLATKASVPVYSIGIAADDTAALIQALQPIRRSATSKATRSLINRMSDYLQTVSVKPDVLVRMDVPGVGAGYTSQFLDAASDALGVPVTQGSLRVGAAGVSDDFASASGLLTGGPAGPLAGKRVLTWAPYLPSEDIAREAAQSLFKKGAASVEFATTAYNIPEGVKAFRGAMEIGREMPKALIEFKKAFSDRRVLSALKAIKDKPQFARAMMSALERPDRPVAGFGAHWDEIKKVAKPLRKWFDELREIDGIAPLNDPTGLNYVYHMQTPQYRRWYNALTPEERRGLTMRLINRMDDVKTRDGIPMGEWFRRNRGPRSTSMPFDDLMRKNPEMVDDYLREWSRAAAEAKKDTAFWKQLDDMGMGDHYILDQMDVLDMADPRMPRRPWNMGRTIDELEDVYHQIGVPEHIRVWDDDILSNLVQRTRVSLYQRTGRRIMQQMSEVAGETPLMDDFLKDYPELRRVLEEGPGPIGHADEVTRPAAKAEIAQEIYERLSGGRTLPDDEAARLMKEAEELAETTAGISKVERAAPIFRRFHGNRACQIVSGPHKGKWFFPDNVRMATKEGVQASDELIAASKQRAAARAALRDAVDEATEATAEAARGGMLTAEKLAANEAVQRAQKALDRANDAVKAARERLKGTQRIVPLYDEQIGKGIAELIKHHQIPGYTRRYAAKWKRTLTSIYDYLFREYKGGLLFATPRRLFRDMIDDNLRGTIEFGTRYLDKVYDAVQSGWRRSPNVVIHGTDITEDAIRQADHYGIFMGTFLREAAGVMGKEGLAEAAEQLSKTVRPGKRGILKRVGQWLAPEGRLISRNPVARRIADAVHWLEDRRRMAAVMSAAEDIAEREGIALGALTQKHLKDWMPEIAERIDRSLYIYSNISPFEKNVASRVVMFYPWLRKNLPFWFNLMAEKPHAALMTMRFFQHLGLPETPEEKMWRPASAREQMAIKVWEDREGRPHYFTGAALSIEDLNRIWSAWQGWRPAMLKLAASLTPLARIPLEQIAGKKFFFNTDIEDYDRTYSILNQIPGLKQYLEVKEEYNPDGTVRRYSMNPQKLYWMNEIRPVMEYLPVLDSWMGDPKTRKPKLETALRGLAGMRFVQGDPEFWARLTSRKILQDNLKSMKKEGRLRSFEAFYVPSGREISEEQRQYMDAMLSMYSQLAQRRERGTLPRLGKGK